MATEGWGLEREVDNLKKGNAKEGLGETGRKERKEGHLKKKKGGKEMEEMEKRSKRNEKTQASCMYHIHFLLLGRGGEMCDSQSVSINGCVIDLYFHQPHFTFTILSIQYMLSNLHQPSRDDGHGEVSISVSGLHQLHTTTKGPLLLLVTLTSRCPHPHHVWTTTLNTRIVLERVPGLARLGPLAIEPALPLPARLLEGVLLRQLHVRRVLEDLHRQPGRRVPRDVAMHEPDARVVRLERDDEVAACGQQGHVASRRVVALEHRRLLVVWLLRLGQQGEVVAVKVDRVGDVGEEAAVYFGGRRDEELDPFMVFLGGVWGRSVEDEFGGVVGRVPRDGKVVENRRVAEVEP